MWRCNDWIDQRRHVVRVHVSLAQKGERGAWIDCDDLNDRTGIGGGRNDSHYSREGYELLGRRFARQAKALIEGTPPVEDGRPE